MTVHSRLIEAVNVVGLAIPQPDPTMRDPCVWDCQRIASINQDLAVLLGESLDEHFEDFGRALLHQAYSHMGAALVAAVDIGSGEDAEDIVRRLVSYTLITYRFPALDVLGKHFGFPIP